MRQLQTKETCIKTRKEGEETVGRRSAWVVLLELVGEGAMQNLSVVACSVSRRKRAKRGRKQNGAKTGHTQKALLQPKLARKRHQNEARRKDPRSP